MDDRSFRLGDHGRYTATTGAQATDMQFTRTLTLYLLVIALSFSSHLGCRESSPTSFGTTAQWKSKFHPIRIEIPPGWRVIPQFKDSAECVTVCLIDDTDGSSLVIKVTEDVSSDLLSNDQYFAAVREQMVNQHPGNKLVDEQKESFANGTFHRMRFTMSNQKFNERFCQELYIRRTGVLAVACQLNYPVCSSLDLVPPEKMKRLLNGLELFDNWN